ncbi:MAG: metalloregulator ArsR/SmtB family transcription factor [Solirubrobacterales bacterium]
MALPTPMPEPLVELIAERFRVLGEPMRIRALDQLRAIGEASVGELAVALGTSQQNVSKHLAALHTANVVSRRREGNRVIYAISDPSVLAICEVVCGSLERRAGEISDLFAEAAA